jgi:hypothetical protein
MAPAGLELAIPTSERQQIHTLDRAAKKTLNTVKLFYHYSFF